MADIFQEVLKWMNGIGDRGHQPQPKHIIYGGNGTNIMSANPEGIKFNSEPQVSRLHPVNGNIPNPIINGVKFNSD